MGENFRNYHTVLLVVSKNCEIDFLLGFTKFFEKNLEKEGEMLEFSLFLCLFSKK